MFYSASINKKSYCWHIDGNLYPYIEWLRGHKNLSLSILLKKGPRKQKIKWKQKTKTTHLNDKKLQTFSFAGPEKTLKCIAKYLIYHTFFFSLLYFIGLWQSWVWLARRWELGSEMAESLYLSSNFVIFLTRICRQASVIILWTDMWGLSDIQVGNYIPLKA